jgi:hypothetical protein
MRSLAWRGAAVFAAMWSSAATVGATEYTTIEFVGPPIVERPFTVHDVAIALSEQGFIAWDSIVWKQGYWIVDDARDANGRKEDLRVDAESLAVVWSSGD